MLKQIFSAVRDGRGLFYDLLPLGAGGTPVSATAAQIASHAYAMPPATQPAVTQASPILLLGAACMLDRFIRPKILTMVSSAPNKSHTSEP